MRPPRHGFTLVEIAIVLLIIGLLLSGVLKGQELIFNSKVKATFNLTREIAAAVSAYKERYGQLPGDDPKATTRFPNADPAVVNGNGDGYIAWSGSCEGANAATEGCQALYQLRLAGFISGAGTGPLQTPLGGMAEIGSGAYFDASLGKTPVLAFHADGLTYKAAGAIDSSFDDGNPATGSWRCYGITSYAAPTAKVNVPGWCTMFL